MKATIELDVGRKTFASGLLPELIAALRRSRPGDLVAIVGAEESIGTELETWCRFTGNALVEYTVEKARGRWVIRCGTVPVGDGFGSTRTSTATCAAITAVCVRHRPRRDENWGSGVYSGLLVKRRNSASRKSL